MNAMDEVIFTGYGIEIRKRAGKLYIRADFGEIVNRDLEFEVTEPEAREAERSERDAYNVLLRLEKSGRPARRV